MTIQDRLSETERHIERIQLKTLSSEDGQRSLDVLMDQAADGLESQDSAPLDINARLDRIEAILESDDS